MEIYSVNIAFVNNKSAVNKGHCEVYLKTITEERKKYFLKNQKSLPSIIPCGSESKLQIPRVDVQLPQIFHMRTARGTRSLEIMISAHG